jgi:ankyrin repeat protein
MAKDAQGQTALHLAPILSPISPVRPPGAKYSFFPAIRLNRMEDFQVWLAADPSLAGITNRDGDTPLMIATWLRRTNMIDRLLAMGVPVDPLSALRLGRIDEFRKMLLEAARPVPDFWMFEAVRFGRIEALQPMIDAGANLHAVDEEGCSLVGLARRSKLDAVEDWLTAHGCRETFFDAIVSGKRASVEKFLVSDKSLATTPNRRGVLPLCAAVIADRPESLKLLAEHGAALDALLDSKWTLLHVAAVYDSADCAKFLLDSGVTTDKLTASSNSALDLASIYGSTNIAGLLVQYGMDVNAQPKGGFGNSPLHWAVHMGQLGMVRWLLAHGADLKSKNTRNKGETPLDLARLPIDAIGMGFGTPPEIRRNYPSRSRSPENCAEILKLLEAATASQN